MGNPELESLSREQLIGLIDIYSKNWLAMDGVWFQAVETRSGMEEAMRCDIDAWKRWTVIEARRLKYFLGLDNHPGLEGLRKALGLRFYGNLNRHEIKYEEDGALILRNYDCRVQTARRRGGMELHPCKRVAVYEYSLFAKEIDERIETECVSCYPDCTESETGCAWRFILIK